MRQKVHFVIIIIISLQPWNWEADAISFKILEYIVQCSLFDTAYTKCENVVFVPVAVSSSKSWAILKNSSSGEVKKQKSYKQ